MSQEDRQENGRLLNQAYKNYKFMFLDIKYGIKWLLDKTQH